MEEEQNSYSLSVLLDTPELGLGKVYILSSLLLQHHRMYFSVESYSDGQFIGRIMGLFELS